MTNDDSQLTRDIAPFGVRMPADLKERVATAAKSNNRSMNAEIVATLEEKYPAPVDAGPDLVPAMISALQTIIDTDTDPAILARAYRARDMLLNDDGSKDSDFFHSLVWELLNLGDAEMIPPEHVKPLSEIPHAVPAKPKP